MSGGVDLPDFGSPLRRIAGSVEKMAGVVIVIPGRTHLRSLGDDGTQRERDLARYHSAGSALT